MVDRTNATSTTAGILRPAELLRHASLERVASGAALGAYVENHWCLRWDLPEGRSFTSRTLPHPACTLRLELGQPRAGVGEDRLVVTGVVTRRFDITLTGRGWVLGTKFRPGGLAALAGARARDWTDRTLPAAQVLPAAVLAPVRGLTADVSPADAAAVADDALSGILPERADPVYASLLGLVTTMLADRDLQRVTQLEQLTGWSRRRLERSFATYVGATPKWVLARYRMHDVVAALDAGYDGSLADLAASSGWYDQAHFGREFTALVGLPPSEYRAHARERRSGSTGSPQQRA
ncbi:AraC family transcriptional regulator [Nocardioides sp. CFH 31398]|uniref:helix-turn-helix domain-containing protein n=1 Tax=Nocardioides sp. CFH 31398 TaxID=2919579 RepID=UPI001F053A4B|nr:helix-turn-helix domain-containing protein [Nocardioides sp. CFH 31398]MCH1866585.1 helix-turn-helix domain-containing protein [Nocardioides sp. CFH 31398]